MSDLPDTVAGNVQDMTSLKTEFSHLAICLQECVLQTFSYHY